MRTNLPKNCALKVLRSSDFVKQFEVKFDSSDKFEKMEMIPVA